MTRRLLTFACEGKRLAATLDGGARPSGLLWVSGGNEIRSGAFAGQAALAAKLAAQGYSVFRYDRRGVGDSEGANMGFRSSTPDIVAAANAFREAAPQITRLVGFGNCDAASALMLAGGAGLDGLALSNPWTFEDDQADHSPPPAAIRNRYAEKLKNPRELLRLVSGQVSFARLAKGLIHALRPPPPPSTLAGEMRQGLQRFAGDVRILLAGNDRTAQAFNAIWDKQDDRVLRCAGAGHAYAEPHAAQWLEGQLLAVLAEK